MGGLCSAPKNTTQVQPDFHSSNSMADILANQFYPPIKHVDANNPWVSMLTPHQLVEIHGAFGKFDRDGDGHIEPKEIKRVMANLGCPQTDEQVRQLIKGVDTDGNGMIEFDEFIGIMAARMLKTDGEGELEQAFSLFDDGSGYISVENIRKVLCEMGSARLSPSELQGLVAMLGADAEGRVSFEAFRSLECWHVPGASIERKQRREEGAAPAPR